MFNALYHFTRKLDIHYICPKIKKVDYKLSQVADLICTMELLKDKADQNGFLYLNQSFWELQKISPFSELCPCKKQVTIALKATHFASSHAEPNFASGKIIKKCGLRFVRYGEFQKLDGSCKMKSMEYEAEF